MMKNLTFEDLNGALILICYDTVSTEDENDPWSHCLPYTVKDGVLIRYELDGDDDVDQTIDLDNYAVAQTTVFDLDCFATPNDLLIKILITEGKEIIREAPFNEEDVVDNRITLTLYDASRKEILSRSRKIGSKAPKQPSKPESEPSYTPEQLNSIGESLLKAQRSLCVSGWKELGFHTLLLVAAGALAVWIFWDYSVHPWMKWVLAVLFGLYFTQVWWSNKRTCPIFVAWPLTRRAEERPWINGGALSGLGMGILFFCFPEVKLADAFFAGLIIAYCVTACWCVFAWLNDLFEDDGNILMPALKSLKRSNRRMARKSFFHNMFGF
jgi:hypothetical protein